MEYQQIYEKLKSIHQEHLLRHWEQYSESQKNSLFLQINKLDLRAYHAQINALKAAPFLPPLSFQPFTEFDIRGSRQDFEKGKKLIAEGAVGCLIVAGGQGTRLGFNGPKGVVPVTLMKHKSLFQLFAEKTLAASKQVGRDLSLAIMTSPLNHEVTVDFFQSHHFFGLKPNQLAFFSQGVLPFLDKEGNLFLDQEGLIAHGPDGNGSVLMNFYESGIWKRWHEEGVRHLNFVLIDNPLADPFDAELFGYHERHRCEVTVKCTKREDLQEKVGLLVNNGENVQVVEYTEISDQERLALNPDGSPTHQCANLSLYCFSMDFIARLARSQSFEMPLHPVFKNIKPGKEGLGWKFEKFIFDVLSFSEKVRALLYPREECFAPLKNFEGNDSIYTVQQALLRSDRRRLRKLLGIELSQAFELSQEFYYPTAEQIDKWKKTAIPHEGYIEA